MNSKEIFVDFLSHIKFRWNAFVIYSFASLLSVSLRIKDLEVNRDFVVETTIIGVIINLVTLAMLFLGFKLVSQMERNRKISLFAPLVTVMGVGAFRGYFLFIVIDWFGFENTIPIYSSVLSSTVYTTIYYGGSCLLIGLLQEGNERFERAFRRAATFRLIAQNQTKDPDTDEIYATVMEKVKSAINSHMPDSPTEDLSNQQALKVSAEIRSQIELVIRPLSHRLWIDSSGKMRTGDPLKIVRDSISQLNYSRTFIVIYQVIIGVFGIGLTIGLTEALVRSLFSIILILLVSYIHKSIYLARYQASLSLSLPFFFVLFFIPLASSLICSFLLHMEPFILQSLLLSPSIPVLAIVSSIYGTVRSDRRLAIAAAISVAASERESTLLGSNKLSKRDLSSYLHNSLQSELFRISKQLQVSADAEEIDATREHLEELSTTLNRTHDEVSSLRERGIDDLRRICDAWSGLAEINLLVVQDLSLDETRRVWLIECVQELITNSIRHGEAKRIEINLENHGNTVVVDLTHDGKGKIVNSTGLGTRYMKSHSQVAPEINRRKGRTSIKLVI